MFKAILKAFYHFPWYIVGILEFRGPKAMMKCIYFEYGK